MPVITDKCLREGGLYLLRNIGIKLFASYFNLITNLQSVKVITFFDVNGATQNAYHNNRLSEIN